MLRTVILVICLYVCFSMHAVAQDSIVSPENISTASLKAIAVTIDLSDPDEVEFTLKKIHTYKYLETVILQGEADDATLKKIIYRLSVLKNLTRLNLKDNELSKAPDNIGTLKTLRSLTVEGNSNLDFNDLFEKINNIPITDLHLTDNDLKKTPAAIASIPTLRKIQLSGSDQLNYEEWIVQLAKLPALTTLAIPVNYITEVPKNIGLLKTLQVLDVSNNILTELPDEISALKAINNLSIQGNLLLNPVKDLGKLKGNDIRFLSLDKELSGEEIEQLKKMFPNAEINFPVNEDDKEEAVINKSNTTSSIPEQKTFTGELKAKKEFTILSGAYLSYAALFRRVVYNFDTLNFEQRYADLRYTTTFQRTIKNINWPGTFHLNKDGKHGFFLPVLKTYPELNAFTLMRWVYDGELSEREFHKKFIARRQVELRRNGKSYRKHKSLMATPVQWEDFRIDYDKNNSLFTIELKGKNGFEKFTAYPVMFNTTHEKSQQTYDRRYLMYQKALFRRSKDFNRSLSRSKRKYNADFNLRKSNAWKELQLQMSDEERLMSMDEWLNYYDYIIANEKKAIDQSSLASGFLITALSLSGYAPLRMPMNTDRSSAPDYGVKRINVDFLDEQGSGKLPIGNIWILDTRNKMMSAQTGSLGLTPSVLPLKQFASQSIIVELRNGNFGVVTREELDKQNLDPTKLCQLKVKVLDKNLNTIGELLKTAGIQ